MVWTAIEIQWITEYAAAQVAAEREACAKVCDAQAERETLRASDGFEGTSAAEACANTIRERSNVEVQAPALRSPATPG